MKTDQTLDRLEDRIKQEAPQVSRGGYIWYDVANCGLESQVCALRLSGRTARHPLIPTLIRFEEWYKK